MKEKIKELIEELEENIKDMEEELKEIEKLKFNAFDEKEFVDASINFRFTRGCTIELMFAVDRLKAILESEVENDKDIKTN